MWILTLYKASEKQSETLFSSIDRNEKYVALQQKEQWKKRHNLGETFLYLILHKWEHEVHMTLSARALAEIYYRGGISQWTQFNALFQCIILAYSVQHKSVIPTACSIARRQIQNLREFNSSAIYVCQGNTWRLFNSSAIYVCQGIRATHGVCHNVARCDARW